MFFQVVSRLIPDVVTGGGTIVTCKKTSKGEVTTRRRISAEQCHALKSHPLKVRLTQQNSSEHTKTGTKTCVRMTDLLQHIDHIRASVTSKTPVPKQDLKQLVEWVKLFNHEIVHARSATAKELSRPRSLRRLSLSEVQEPNKSTA